MNQTPPRPLDDLDDLDLRILDILQNDAALTNQELAQKVHASPPTCFRRVRRLRSLGYIAREVAILAPEKLGAGLTAIVEISLDVQTAEELDAFEGDILNEPAIQQVYRVSTGPDFILILQLPDMPAYHTLAHRLFTSKKNVRNVRTFFAVHRSKFETRLPLPGRP
ncbi:MAG TPA: Lrp/AsnC family transcriptional regulator [Burkholderiaceae bacterium]|nr:Lrp/AsnC family transcriptional regulator [Burkholderiaceae bacterium]